MFTVRHMILAAACLLASRLGAQETRGQIIGRVTDSGGSVLVGAVVTGTNLETNLVSNGVTNAAGDFVLPFLIPGPYKVVVEMKGFRQYVENGVTVVADDKVTINVKLDLGTLGQTVQVTAEASLVDATDASIGQTVEAHTIVELPLKDGNPLMLAELSPGVMNLSSGGMTRPFDNANTSSMVINGSRTGTNEYRIDGAPNTAGTSGNVAYIPMPGVVSEVKVQTSPFDASVGFSTGGNINASLKTGTNALHGQVYYFLQNPALNANSFFNNLAGLPRDDYRQNRWGANANGPVVIPHLYNGHNRTFWMYGYEGIYDSLPSGNQTYTVPTPAQMQGNFSSLLSIGSQYTIYDPATIQPASGGHFSRQPFPNNTIPVSRINSTAEYVLARYFPAANLPGATSNYTVPLLEKNRFMSHVFRVDTSVSDKNRMFVRGTYNNRYQDYEDRLNGGAGYNYWRNNRGFGIDDVHIFSPVFLLNTRYNYTRYTQRTDPFTVGLDLTTLGFPQSYVNQIKSINSAGVMLPDIAISNYPELNAQSISTGTNDIHAMAFAFTRIKNSHTLNFGGEYRVYRDTSSNLGRSSGNMSFGTNWTRGPLDNSSSAPLGQGLASFLLGLPTGGYLDNNANYAEQYGRSGFYVQDAWKVTARLTVTLGLRWELEAPTTERYNRGVRGFDFTTPSPIAPQAEANYAAILSNPANAGSAGVQYLLQNRPAGAFQVIGGLTFAGVGGNPRQMWDANNRDLEPRAAIAWQMDSHTVIRAGYGIFYDIARQTVDQTGFSQQTPLVASQDTGQTFVGTLDNPFPNGFLMPSGSSLGLMTNVGQNVNPKYTHLLDPYMQRWQLSVQRRIGRQALVEIAYVGNRATHLRVTRNNVDSVPRQYLTTLPTRNNALNSLLTANVPNPYYNLVPGTSLNGSTVQVQQLLRPYSQFTGGSTTSNEGYSWYHSLQTRVEKRFTGGYTLTGAWTWSKFMEATGFLNNTDAAPAQAISDQDRTHRMVGSVIYELPFGRGKRWAQSLTGVPGALVNGWQVQGIYQWQSGPPLGFGDIPFYGSVQNIPLPADQRTIQRWFNTNAGFDFNSADDLVYHIRTFPLRFSGLRGAGLNQWDLGASRNARLSERTALQFRAEFINALNHAQFNTPQMDPTSTDFGRVTSTTQQPRNIQFGLKVLF